MRRSPTANLNRSVTRRRMTSMPFTLGRVGARLRAGVDRVVWWVARGAVDAVRYRPGHVELVVACGAGQPDVPPALVRWVTEMRERSAAADSRVPAAMDRAVAEAARWLGPTPSALVRWFSGAARTVADYVGAETIERPLRARAHPGLLVPHLHLVA